MDLLRGEEGLAAVFLSHRSITQAGDSPLEWVRQPSFPHAVLTLGGCIFPEEVFPFLGVIL